MVNEKNSVFILVFWNRRSEVELFLSHKVVGDFSLADHRWIHWGFRNCLVDLVVFGM